MRIISTRQSLNNQYELVIKQTDIISRFIPVMPGQRGLGDKSVIAVLKHNGKVIESSEDEILYQSLNIEWNLKQNEIYYTKLNYFNLLENQEK